MSKSPQSSAGSRVPSRRSCTARRLAHPGHRRPFKSEPWDRLENEYRVRLDRTGNEYRVDSVRLTGMMNEMRKFIVAGLLGASLTGCVGGEFTLGLQESPEASIKANPTQTPPSQRAMFLTQEAGSPATQETGSPPLIQGSPVPTQEAGTSVSIPDPQPTPEAATPTAETSIAISVPDAGPIPETSVLPQDAGYILPTFCSPFGRSWGGAFSECHAAYSLEMPIQFGAIKNDAGLCGSEWTPRECQCAETFTCECILARAGFGPEATCRMESQVQGLPPGPKGPDFPPDLPVVTGYRKGY
jgi:hypothetical protein